MDFGWPILLLSLLAVPVLLAGYVLLLRRRRRRAVPYSSVALLRAARPARTTRRRHLPVAFLLGALACLGLAAARPQAKVDVPVSGSAVILAVDVSGSMCATDVEPNRLTAAQAAVRTFVRAQDPNMRIGLVVFSGFAQLTVPPTTERAGLLRAIDSLTTGRGTTIGAAILKSIDAIAQIDASVRPIDDAEAALSGDPGDPSSDIPPICSAVHTMVVGFVVPNPIGYTRTPREAASFAASCGETPPVLAPSVSRTTISGA